MSKFLQIKYFKKIRFWGIAALWLMVMLAFYKKEVGPAFRESRILSPQLQLSSASLTREEWLGIFYQGKQLGYSHTSLYPYQEKGFYGPALENNIWLELPFWGKQNRLQSYSLCLLSSQGKIKHLTFRVSSSDPHLLLKGKSSKSRLQVTLEAMGEKREFSLSLPEDSFPLYSLTPLFALRPLKKGEIFTLPALDLIKSLTSQKLEPGTIRFEVVDQSEEGYHLLAFYGGMTIDIRLDQAGNVIRLSTPIGWELEKQNHEEIMAFIKTF